VKLIVTANGTSNLCEVGQTVPVKQAICVETDADTYENVTSWIKCRDYFNDLNWVQHNKYPEPIVKYGFHWQYSQKLVDDLENTGRLKIALLANTDEYAKNFETNMHLINDADKRLGMKATTITKLSASEVDNKDWEYGNGEGKTFYLISGDKKWFSNSPILSLYTLIIRSCCNKKLIGYTNFEKAFVDLSTDAHFTCQSDGGLIKQCARDEKAWKLFLDKWEEYMGWAGQPISLERLEKYGKSSSQSRLLSILHDQTGIASMMHAVRTKPDTKNKDDICNGVFDWQVKFHGGVSHA